MESRIIRMDANGTAFGGGDGYGFCVQPALEPEISAYDDAVPNVSYARPGAFPVLVRPEGEAPFWVYNSGVYRRSDRPFRNLRLERGLQNEIWNVITLNKDDFFVPPDGPKRTIVVPCENSGSPYSGGADITTTAASLAGGLSTSVNWYWLRQGTQQLQFLFTGTLTNALTFYVQNAHGQVVALGDTWTPSTDGAVLTRSFPGVRLWVQSSGAGTRMWVDALVEVG